MVADKPTTQYEGANDYLKRLPSDYYRGEAYVHWTMSVADRKTGWLTDIFHRDWREVMIHAMCRFQLLCPIYCCMPDHFHLIWIGYQPNSDQLSAMKYLRKHTNRLLERRGASLQQQAYDHVLTEEERDRDAFESVAEYIARNPERADLVGVDRFRDYPFTGCVILGYPELELSQSDYWTRFWRVRSYLMGREKCDNSVQE